jgi:hypothetical protein
VKHIFNADPGGAHGNPAEFRFGHGADFATERLCKHLRTKAQSKHGNLSSVRLAHQFQFRSQPRIVAVGGLWTAEGDQAMNIIKIVGQRLTKINAHNAHALTV